MKCGNKYIHTFNLVDRSPNFNFWQRSGHTYGSSSDIIHQFAVGRNK
jgi:hypothetical protein